MERRQVSKAEQEATVAELEQRCNDGAEALTNQQGQLEGQDAHYQGLLEAGAAAFSELEA